jgi:hypothetical protein
VEVEATPFCGILARMTIEDGEKALATHTREIVDEGVRVLHRAALALILMESDMEGSVVFRMYIQLLQWFLRLDMPDLMQRGSLKEIATYAMSGRSRCSGHGLGYSIPIVGRFVR